MEIEYLRVSQSMAMVDIPEIGDFGMEAYNDNNEYYYMFVKTILGETYIATCGPVIPDTDVISQGFETLVTHTNFNEKKLFKIVSTFLNDWKKQITGVNLMDADEVIPYFKDIREMLRNVLEGRA